MIRIKHLILFCIVVLSYAHLNGQTVFIQEDFESGAIPSDWIQQSLATDGGWNFGSAAQLSSQAWAIPNNGSLITATNDDECNCDKSADFLILPMLDFTNSTAVVLEAQVFYGKRTYQNDTEEAYLKASTDGGITWNIIDELDGETGWSSRVFNLTNYAGMDNVLLAFHYDDNGGWLYGFALDDVVVYEPLSSDAELSDLTSRSFGETDTPFPISGKVTNKGGSPINSLDITYTVDGQNPESATIDNLNIAPFTAYDFEHPMPWTPMAEGTFTVAVKIDAVNGAADGDDQNNELDIEVEIYPKVIVPNKIDMFAAFEHIYTEIGNSSDLLDKPTDLDFFPLLGKRELWVINERLESNGGSTVTYYNAGEQDQSSERRIDGNAWHFMSLPTALAFSTENGNWASSTGVLDANHNGGTFTGPTLWSSDPDIYAQPSGGNGSHLDMLHGSPYSMGIAHEVDNAFWVFDGYNEHIVRYDFVDDHGPGNDDHADAIVRRYTQVVVKRDSPVPSHLILDKDSGWLYIVDNGNDRVLRIDINSGVNAGSLPPINEPLAEHSQITGVTTEVIITEGLDRPCGIDIIENRLIVSDYGTGDIIIYDVDNNFLELNRIQTGEIGITGIKIGPEGNIWYTNRLNNTIMMVSPSDISKVADLEDLFPVSVTPNPTNGLVNINIRGYVEGDLSYKVMTATGQLLTAGEITSNYHNVDLSQYQNGMYFIQLFNETHATTKRVVLNK